MIKSKNQAQRIQEKRVARGKPGHSRAVRRFLKATCGDLNDLDNYNRYLTMKSQLPHIDNFPTRYAAEFNLEI